MFYLFYIIILGTWEGGNSKNRENKKCFQNVKKSSISLPDLRKIPQTQDSQCPDVRHMEGGGKRHKRTMWWWKNRRKEDLLIKSMAQNPNFSSVKLSCQLFIIFILIVYRLSSVYRLLSFRFFVTALTL